MISNRAGLVNTDWDGYLKHFRPSIRYQQKQQQLFAQQLSERLKGRRKPLGSVSTLSSSSEAAAPAVERK